MLWTISKLEPANKKNTAGEGGIKSCAKHVLRLTKSINETTEVYHLAVGWNYFYSLSFESLTDIIATSLGILDAFIMEQSFQIWSNINIATIGIKHHFVAAEYGHIPHGYNL